MHSEPDGPRSADIAVLQVSPVVEYGLAVGLQQAGFATAQPGDLLNWAFEAPGRVVVLPDTETGLDTLRQLRAIGPELLSVALLLQPDYSSYRRALALCTSAVPLEADLGMIVEVVVAARHGRCLLPAFIAQRLAVSAPDTTHASMTREEISWLRVLAGGGTVAAMARAEGYSEREMYRRLGALYTKVGATTRTDALLKAQRLGLLDIDLDGKA